MIPRKLHYCWMSDDPLSESLQACVDSWSKHLGDFELIHWNSGRFDVHAVPFVSAAFKERKWAFVADYVRAYALYHEGGIYLDSD